MHSAPAVIYTLSLHDALPILELRRRNYIPPSAMPHNTTAGWTIAPHVGWTYDSGEFAKLTDRALELADWPGFQKRDRKSTRLNSSHRCISYAVFCLKKKTKTK